MAQTKYIPKILFVTNSTASKLWRVLPQARHCLNLGYNVSVIDTNGFSEKSLVGKDIAILQMVFDARVFKKAKKLGCKIVFEIDDLLHWLPVDHYAKKKINWKWIFDAYRAIRLADAVTVTNDNLKKHYNWLRIFKRKIDILPNYVDLDYWEHPQNINKTKEIRIGYCGGKSHVNDLKIILKPLKRILKEYDSVKFIQVGAGGFSTGNPITEYNYGKDLFKDLPIKKREYSLGAPMNYWSTKLNSLQLNIGLAPVKDNIFSRSKTPIKWMEYGINKVPSICTDFLYKDVIDNGENGYLAKTEDDWYKYMKELIDNPGKRILMGRKAYYKIKKDYDLKKHLYKWSDIYKELIIK